MGVKGKPKGNNYENTIAKEIRATFLPEDFDPVLAHNLIHRTPQSGGGPERGDIIIKPPIWEFFPWFIECRNRQSWSFKNIWEKHTDSIIMKWFFEDAVAKCHPYDTDSRYPRAPLLVFTRNQHKNYFCAWASDLNLYLYVDYMDIEGTFRPCMMVQTKKEAGDIAVIGRFDTFLELHKRAPQKEVLAAIEKYVGANNAST
jgi:hypothetical protein